MASFHSRLIKCFPISCEPPPKIIQTKSQQQQQKNKKNVHYFNCTNPMHMFFSSLFLTWRSVAESLQAKVVEKAALLQALAGQHNGVVVGLNLAQHQHKLVALQIAKVQPLGHVGKVAQRAPVHAQIAKLLGAHTMNSKAYNETVNARKSIPCLVGWLRCVVTARLSLVPAHANNFGLQRMNRAKSLMIWWVFEKQLKNIKKWVSFTSWVSRFCLTSVNCK